ncbi:MAG: hypothetical protein ACPGUV_03200 [Polyangiales bacterium]
MNMALRSTFLKGLRQAAAAGLLLAASLLPAAWAHGDAPQARGAGAERKGEAQSTRALQDSDKPGQARIDRPLPAKVKARLAEVPSEDLPRSQTFYFRSNEWRQDLLRPHLRGKGGIYLGVGSDQSYTMAAMAGAEFVFLVDFDPRIPLVHRTYGALIRHSPTAAALLHRFDEAKLSQSVALLERELADDPDRARMIKYFRRHRGPWQAYLRRVARGVRHGKPFTWLSGPRLYAYVRTLHQRGRIVSRVGDVTGHETLQAYARVARDLQLPVRTVYFSNAEQFFRYTPQFVANMAALPTDSQSVVVRTIRHARIAKAEDGRWHYMVHAFDDFLERMRTPYYRKSFALVGDLLAAGPPFLGRGGISTMTRDTPRTFLRQAQQQRRGKRRARQSLDD